LCAVGVEESTDVEESDKGIDDLNEFFSGVALNGKQKGAIVTQRSVVGNEFAGEGAVELAVGRVARLLCVGIGRCAAWKGKGLAAIDAGGLDAEVEGLSQGQGLV